MELFGTCPACGFEDTFTREVEKFLKINNDILIVKIKVEVCKHCGEKIYEPKTIEYLENIKKQFIENKDEINLNKVGMAFKVAV